MRRRINALPQAGCKWLTAACVQGALALLCMSACAPEPQPPAHSSSSADQAADLSVGRASPLTDDHRINWDSMGKVRLGMTLGEARDALATASFARTSDGEGLALAEVLLGEDDGFLLFADEPDPGAPIDWSRRIVWIQTFSPRFRTAEGIGPGSLVTDVVTVYGPIREITLSEIESREFIQFERQPAGLTFRLDYTGIFPPHEPWTTRCEPGAKIMAVEIASRR